MNTSPLPFRRRVLAEKSALDNGWEVQPTLEPTGWLRCSSSLFSDVVWLALTSDVPVLACARKTLWLELSQEWPSVEKTEHGMGGIALASWESIDPALRRAAHLARSLPNQVARDFRTRTAQMPQFTEAERLVVQRVGHIFFVML